MAETGNGAATPQQAPQIQLNVINQFVRDKKREADNQYEVSIKLKIENRDKNNPATKVFLMEIDYAGLFFIAGVPDEQMHPFLLIECPRLLFPFLRRIVSDISRDGGFPPLNLDNIDFMQLYRQELERRQAGNA
jgi:preprotein translocase subunit SecB